MTTFERRSTGTDYNNHDSHRRWTVAHYDYALQVLKAQQQFTHSVLAATAPILHVARDITVGDPRENRSTHSQRETRSDQRGDDSHRSQTNEPHNDDDTAEHNKRSTANNRSANNTPGTSRTERANTQTEEAAETRARVTYRKPF